MILLIPFSQKGKSSSTVSKKIVLAALNLSARLGNECNSNEMKSGLVDAAEVQEQFAKQEFGDSTSSSACFTFILAGSCHS